MKIKVLDKRWWLVFSKQLLKKTEWGHCDPPNATNKCIIIHPSLLKQGKDEKLMEIVIHEMTHAAGWHLDETYVEEFSRDVARALTRLGFSRKV